MNKTLSLMFRFLGAQILCLLLMVGSAKAEDVTLNFSDADLVAVINSVSQITGKNFIIDPRVKGKVTVISSKPLNEDEVYNVFLSILQVHGFATVPTENAIKIIPDATAKQNAAPFASRDGDPEDQLVTRVLTINYINAAQLVPILRPLVAQQGHLAAYATTNVLIISDRASNIKRIDRIIAEMDRKSDSEIEIIKLKHAFAAEVVRLLASLNAIGGDAKNQAQGRVMFTADERTNSILLSGEKSKRLRYRAIIADLDSPVASSGNTHVVYLRYAKASNIAEILTKVGQEVIKGESINSDNFKSGANLDAVSVQADETSNALVITAPASVFPSLRAVIQQLDIRRAQVHIEAIIAEVLLETSLEYGVQWLIDGTNSGNAALASKFSGKGSPIDGLIPPDGGDGGIGSISDGLSLVMGSVGGSGIDFVTLIQALAGNSDSNLLSTPSLVTLDNEPAELIVGQNIPIVSGESSTTTGDLNNPFRTIERQDVGVSLKVTPQINEGNTITMQIEQEVSSISLTSVIASDVVTNKRQIKATIQLEDGELLVLGGLIDDVVLNQVQKVPLLGDIPVIGQLFRSTTKSNKKNNLLVFIRATIIKDPDIARSLSHRKYNYMRDTQLLNNEDLDVNDKAILAPLESYE
ncbi:MAG: type II secretion system secretin GspD [Gammaproteobacteria bacterium]